MKFIRKTIRKAVAIACISGVVMVANLPMFNAFEAHIINVTATTCSYSEIRSKGFWKTHITGFDPYMPQYIGNEHVDTAPAAVLVLQQGDSDLMVNKLRAQLLAMKFNIAYFNVGDYLDETEGKTLSQIAAEADLMLINGASDSDMEEIKDLLDYWNTQESLRFCFGTSSTPTTPVVTESLVINKVYFNPDQQHTTDCTSNEWVEIFNPTPADIDIMNWEICDNYSCDLLSQESLIIPSGTYAVISDNENTWGFWNMPDEVVKIVLEGRVGNGLGDASDMLILKNSEGENVDQMNWGIPIITWTNYNDDLWDPGITGFVRGDVLGRDPNGVDTDQVSDWTVYKLPSVTVLYPSDGGEILYHNQITNIRWTAINSNGANEDLSIDIWYSSDSGATWANIVRGTQNDGLYEFLVPVSLVSETGGIYFTCTNNGRIKIVATDYTKNFMLSNWDISDNDFDPPIDFDSLTPEEIAMFESIGITRDTSPEEAMEIIMAVHEIPTEASEPETTETTSSSPAPTSEGDEANGEDGTQLDNSNEEESVTEGNNIDMVAQEPDEIQEETSEEELPENTEEETEAEEGSEEEEAGEALAEEPDEIQEETSEEELPENTEEETEAKEGSEEEEASEALAEEDDTMEEQKEESKEEVYTPETEAGEEQSQENQDDGSTIEDSGENTQIDFSLSI